MNTWRRKIAICLHRSRQESGISGYDMAAALNVDRRTIRRWERGEHDVPSHMLEKWFDECGYQIAISMKRVRD